MQLRLPAPQLAAALLTSGLAAQAVATDHVAGWSLSASSPSSPGQIDVQDIAGGCRAARRVCAAVLKGRAGSFLGGATAWDASRQAVWISDGTTIAVRSLPGCRQVCQFKAQLLNPGDVVSGLAISDAKRRLYQLESRQGFVGLRSYDLRSCPPVPLRDGCTVGIQSNAVAGGLAYDEARDLLYFTESFPAFVGWLTNLHVARAAGKCKPVCKVGMRSCGTPAHGQGPILGLAYDACSSRLWATDGRVTSITDMVDPVNCRIRHAGCCARQSQGSFRGLAFLPGWAAKRSGGSCLPKGCRFCSAMRSRLGGEPSLGNPAFGFELGGGPSGSFAFLVLGAGCGGGLNIPLLCGPLYPLLSPLPVLSPPVRLTGGPCTGAARVPLPLPVLRGLCGLKLCAQWVVACGPLLGVSDAIGFPIVGT